MKKISTLYFPCLRSKGAFLGDVHIYIYIVLHATNIIDLCICVAFNNSMHTNNLINFTLLFLFYFVSLFFSSKKSTTHLRTHLYIHILYVKICRVMSPTYTPTCITFSLCTRDINNGNKRTGETIFKYGIYVR